VIDERGHLVRIVARGPRESETLSPPKITYARENGSSRLEGETESKNRSCRSRNGNHRKKKREAVASKERELLLLTKRKGAVAEEVVAPKPPLIKLMKVKKTPCRESGREPRLKDP